MITFTMYILLYLTFEDEYVKLFKDRYFIQNRYIQTEGFVNNIYLTCVLFVLFNSISVCNQT